jgi:hypothetical protein
MPVFQQGGNQGHGYVWLCSGQYARSIDHLGRDALDIQKTVRHLKQMGVRVQVVQLTLIDRKELRRRPKEAKAQVQWP